MLSVSSFSFLDGQWIDVKNVAQNAENSLYNDPTTTLIKLRTFGEMLAKIILDIEGLNRPADDNQYQRLRNLSEREILPNNIAGHFHSIRIDGNEAAHRNSGSIGNAVANLEAAYFIAAWAYKTYDDATFEVGEYQIPQRTTQKTITEPITVAHNQRNHNTRQRPRQPGDKNDNQQELIERTNEHSTTNQDQYIWILKCLKCSNYYGANGCDFHIRRCPECQGGRKGEEIGWWKSDDKSNENKKSIDNKSVNQITLHEAMCIVLSSTEDGTMHASKLADEIFARRLYFKKDGDKASPGQIRLRAMKYSDLFDMLPGNYISLNK